MKKENNLVIAIALLVVVIFLWNGFSMMSGNWGYSHMMGYYGPGLLGFGWIFMFIVFVALILLIVWILIQLQNNESSKPKKKGGRK